VFPVPNIPAKGRTVMAHIKVFMFHERINLPIASTTCISRGWFGADAPVYVPSHETPSLTIAARGKSGEISLSMLILLDNDEGGKYPSSFPYRLLRLSPVAPTVTQDSGGCTQICLGSSGRGLFVFGGKVRLCGPSLLFIPPCEMQFGPEFETERVVYDVETGDTVGGDKVDFDEGMGRLVVAKGSGGFDVVQLL
jgi:hypothetical protein